MLVSLLHGEGVRLDDPAETYHEASRLSAATALAQLPGLQLLEDEPLLQASVARSARRHSHRPGVDLRAPKRLRMPLGEALDLRCSGLVPPTRQLRRRELGALLDAAYGLRLRGGEPRRSVPSGGALYPLELYVAALSVEGAREGLYHFDAFASRLADLGQATDELATALVDPSLLERTSVAIVITAVFWRTRFKYGQRGYRFALLEAGHVAQNLVLAAAALRLSALPVGGFYDRAVEQALGVDGLEESALAIVLIGGSL